MIVTVLYRLENEPSAAAASFTDVVSGQYYTDAVAWANANGIVTGYGNGKFGPNDIVTREQLAADPVSLRAVQEVRRFCG